MASQQYQLVTASGICPSIGLFVKDGSWYSMISAHLNGQIFANIEICPYNSMCEEGLKLGHLSFVLTFQVLDSSKIAFPGPIHFIWFHILKMCPFYGHFCIESVTHPFRMSQSTSIPESMIGCINKP